MHARSPRLIARAEVMKIGKALAGHVTSSGCHIILFWESLAESIRVGNPKCRKMVIVAVGS